MALPLHDGSGSAGNASPPPTQLMQRLSSSDSVGGGEEVGDPYRIPAAVFERDPSQSNMDWSMMSTESVFGLQVAPSSDFTGFFLAHPELMDIATPPRSSSAVFVDAEADVDADAKAAPVISPPFESIPELPESAMKGNYSFAFPNLIEDKRNYSKKQQSRRDHQPEPAAPTMEAAKAVPAPAEAEAKAEAQPETSSKPEAAPAPGSGKGGLFSCFPCC